MADPLGVSPSSFIFCYCGRWQTKLSSLNLELREDFWLSLDFSLQLHRGERVRKQQSLSETQRIGGGVSVHKATARWCKTSFSDCFMAVPQRRVISFSMKLAGMLIPSRPLSVPIQSSTYLQLIKHQLTHEVADLRVSVTLFNIHQFTRSKTSFQRENVNISTAALELDAKAQNVINTLS